MISALPDEIWVNVFSYLSNVTICKVISKVCRHWHVLSFDPQLWRKVNISGSDLKLTRKRFDCLRLHRDLSTAKYVSFLRQEIADDILKDLVDVNPDIYSLSLSHFSKLTNQGANNISRLSKLKHLRLSFCNISDESITTIVSNSQNIECLCVNSCNKLTNQFLHAICRLQNLSHLEIINSTKISNAGLEYLSWNTEKLTHLSVSFSSSILTSESLCTLNFSQLHSVEFSLLDIDSDNNLLCFVINNPSLREMKLVECDIFGSFIHQCNLTKLEMIRSQNLSKEFYDYFKNNTTTKNLEELNVVINEQCDFSTSFSSVKRLTVRILESSNLNFSAHLTKYEVLRTENLVDLTLWHDRFIAKQSTLEYLLDNCKNLIRLFIRRISFSSSKSLNLTENLSIRYFLVYYMKNVDEILFEKFAKAIPNVCNADFSYNSEVTLAMLKGFCNYCCHLQSLTLIACDIPDKEIVDLKLNYNLH